jgi:hypothetical protein
MVVKLESDNKGTYYVFGKYGTKYYFNPNNFREGRIAYGNALRQQYATVCKGIRKGYYMKKK